MMTAQFLSTCLALAPPPPHSPPSEFGAQLDYVEVVGDDNNVQLIGYDDTGAVIGSIALWLDARERLHIDSDYGDGYAEVTISNGEVSVDSTLPPDVLGARARLIVAVIDANGPQEGKVMCGVAIVGTVASCAALVVEEWEGYSCP